MVSIIAAVVFSYYFVNIAYIPNWIKSKLKYPAGKRLKPLDCPVCLSVYIAGILYFFPSVSEFIAVAFGAGIISNIIAWITKK